jgi:hypothetical protein
MSAPKERVDIRTDVNVSIALACALAAAKSIHDAQWWDEEAYLQRAQDDLEQSLKYIKAARATASRPQPVEAERK